MRVMSLFRVSAHRARLALVALALLLAPTLSMSAARADADAAFTRLATENFADIEAGITKLAASGSDKAQAALDALTDSRLFYRPSDKAVFIKLPAGGMSMPGPALHRPPTPAPSSRSASIIVSDAPSRRQWAP
jgi:hypothetical protein